VAGCQGTTSETDATPGDLRLSAGGGGEEVKGDASGVPPGLDLVRTSTTIRATASSTTAATTRLFIEASKTAWLPVGGSHWMGIAGR
jgi:hypothetical protein